MMASYCASDESEFLRSKLTERTERLFRRSNGKAQLDVLQLSPGGDVVVDATLPEIYHQVENRSEIRTLEKKAGHCSQLFIIRQKRSWTNLDISYELFEDFISIYNVFPSFLKCIFAFGAKQTENEFEFPDFMSRRTYSTETKNTESCESAYVVRRVERNGRRLIDGQSPWSIRQTAVYHRFRPSMSYPKGCALMSPSTFLLVAPSPTFEARLSCSLKKGSLDQISLSPWYIHWLLLADSSRGWSDYLAWLEVQLREQSEPILLATIGSKRDISPDGFHISFVNRQKLKQLEDYTIDLKVIFRTMVDTVSAIRAQCLKCCLENRQDCETYPSGFFIEEFDRYAKEARTLVSRAQAFHDKIQSSTQLLSNVLDYEEASAMKDLSQASYEDSKLISALTLQNTRDAMAVKFLTTISLVYLPTTIVLNFFSTTFVQNNGGNMQVSTQVWILGAVSIPLTILTIALWWACVRIASPLQQNSSQSPGRSNTLWSWAPRSGIVRYDLESRVGSPSKAYSGNSASSSARTWSTTATTLREK